MSTEVKAPRVARIKEQERRLEQRMQFEIFMGNVVERLLKKISDQIAGTSETDGPAIIETPNKECVSMDIPGYAACVNLPAPRCVSREDIDEPGKLRGIIDSALETLAAEYMADQDGRSLRPVMKAGIAYQLFTQSTTGQSFVHCHIARTEPVKQRAVDALRNLRRPLGAESLDHSYAFSPRNNVVWGLDHSDDGTLLLHPDISPRSMLAVYPHIVIPGAHRALTLKDVTKEIRRQMQKNQ